MTPSKESSNHENPVDVVQQFSRRSLIATLFVVAILGGTGLALILSPEGAVARSSARAAWLFPLVIVFVVVALQASMNKRRWNPASPEVKALMQDEWRRLNLDRASRYALIVVLAAQWPLGLLIGFISGLPTVRAAMAMAAASITLGLITFLTLFLFFDRE
ncbi:MAG TPA: hypothetical protein VF701_00870 [Thermoanaerobaculia bacterium]